MLRAESRITGLAARLTRRAATLAAAHGELIVRRRRSDPLRWRVARLIWPLFGRR